MDRKIRFATKNDFLYACVVLAVLSSDCIRPVPRADRGCIDALTRHYGKSPAPASIYVSSSLSRVTERASPMPKIFPLRGRRTTQTRQSRAGRSEMQLLQ